MDIYKYVDGSTAEPMDTIQLATWMRNDYTPKGAILSFLSEDSIYLFREATTDKDPWKVVEDNREWRNLSTLHHIVQSFFPIKIPHTDVLIVHISSYEQKHSYTTERCRIANDP